MVTAPGIRGSLPTLCLDMPKVADYSGGDNATCSNDPRAREPGGKMPTTVLVVEDNELNMKLFCDVLESEGHTVVRAYSGHAARHTVQKHKLDMIVMDIQLPDISGLDLIREIKADPLLKSIPVLAVTAFAMKGDAEAIQAAGSDGYLTKPIAILDFMKAVERILGRDSPKRSSLDNNPSL